MKKLLILLTFFLLVFCLSPKDALSVGCGDPCLSTNNCDGGLDCDGSNICACPNPGVEVCTAIGCLSQNPNELIKWILTKMIGVSGVIAFFLIVAGSFQVMTSGGDPESAKKGGEMITSAIQGLLFIIFSLFLLKLIGVEILRIPGFGVP